MTQLIVNGTEYPEITSDRFKCYPKKYEKTARMAGGRLVTDIGYTYQVIEAGPYDYIENSVKETMLGHLRSGEELTVVYLPDCSDTPVAGTFKCTKLTPPTYLFQKNDASYWRGLSFILEAVRANA